MARHEKGGVHTQKVSAILTVLMLLVTGTAFVIAVADQSADGAYTNVEGSSTYSGVSKTTTFTLTGDSDYYFTASLVNSSGTAQSSAVSPSSGTLSSSTYKYTVTVTAPSTSGQYYLKIVFYEDSTKATKISEKTAPLKVVDAIVLSATLKNTTETSLTMTVYFMVNGTKIDDSEQSVTVAAASDSSTKGVKTVTYNYYTKDVGDFSFSLQSDDANVSEMVTGLGTTHKVYSSDDSYDFLTWFLAIVLVIMVIILVYIYRKPVVNTGKPKARR
jgi:hypothetical protein